MTPALRIPARDAAAGRFRDKRVWRLRDGQRFRTRRNGRGNGRRRFGSGRSHEIEVALPARGFRSRSALDGLTQRFTPGPAKGIHVALYHEGSIMLDAKLAADNSTDTPNFNLTLCRNFIHAGKRRGRKRYYRARTALAEKRWFGSHTLGIEPDIGGEAVAIEAGFRESDGEATVADVMRGDDCVFGREFHKAIDQVFLSR